uniref:serine/threonine-protein kinase Nek11-like n=1 Tax=Semicossyphus pulcher TaxID=241346 RepID=UPI0037E9ABC9
MGQKQSTLTKEGYTLERETEHGYVVTKDGEKFLIITNIKGSKNVELIQEMNTLKDTGHPHIMSIKETFKDEALNDYVVTEYCEGGTLAEKMREKSFKEPEALSMIAEVCMALRSMHEKNVLHKHLTPQNIFLTEFGKVCLGGFCKVKEKYYILLNEGVWYQAPEVFTNQTYDAKSEVWSLGCILYELCTQKSAFSAENTVDLVSKFSCGSGPHLDDEFSEEFRELLSAMFQKDPNSRPTACEILERHITLTCIFNKCKTTAEYLQTQLVKLKAVADNLERVHTGTTIGSLAGGVVGAAGGIATIVGLALSPFTMGASLIVTGTGVAVSVAGGVTAGASNITNMVTQSSDRKAVRRIIKEFEEKVNALATWLQEIGRSLVTMKKCLPANITRDEGSSFKEDNQAKAAVRLGKGLGTVTELFRHLRVANIGKIAGQASRSVRVAEVATGALSGLFVAVDIFFIAVDAKEIHNIRQTQEDGETSSEIMKFVLSIRKSAKELQEVLDEFKETISSVKFLDDKSELEWDCSVSQ